MTGLDRDQMPVRFTVVTSVASGLIVAVIVSMFRSGITGDATLMWFVLTFGGVAAVTWIASSVLSRVRKGAERAFLVTSAFSQKYFVADFVKSVHNVFDSNGTDLVLKVPDRDYDASAQSHHLSRILDRRHDYVGGIIVVTEMRRLRDDLIAFCRKSRLPVVFTDVEPFDREIDYPYNTAFVGYDTGELGELAGTWLVQRLRGKPHPHILIIASREHVVRQVRCEQALRSGLRDVVITTDAKCDFVRSLAYKAVRSHIQQLEAGQCLDAIFCTNDEMALGAVDALAVAAPAPATRETLVVGIDGVLEATTLIDTAASPLRATVVQDTQRLAGNIIDVLEKMRRGREVPTRTILPAKIYETT
jgi:ribose transport system substrate-binding protein